MALWLLHGGLGGLDIEVCCQEGRREQDSGTWPLAETAPWSRKPHAPLCSMQTCGSRRSFTEPWVTWAFPPAGLCWVLASPHTHPAAKGRQTPHRPEGRSCLAGRRGPASVGAKALPKRDAGGEAVERLGLSNEAPPGQDMEGEVAGSLAEATLPSGASVSFSVSTPISTLMRHGVDEKRGAALGGSRSGFAPLLTCSCPSPGSSGFLPGVCGVAVGYPLDTVKVW